jgi:upstream activation factor subunit UAF30
MESLLIEIAAVRAENKQIIKLLRKLRTVQDDPDGNKAKERASKNGFSKLLNVSEKLSTFLGLAAGEKICRSEVTRRISTYVKEHGLKHPDNGRVIVLDDKLTTLLSPPANEQITYLNIQKYLSPHYLKTEPVPEPVPEPQAAPAPTPVKRPVVKKKPVA